MTVIIITLSVTLAIIFAISAKVQADINRHGGCPRCGTPVPLLRIPTSVRQSFFGGWTCRNCGDEMDRSGRLLES